MYFSLVLVAGFLLLVVTVSNVDGVCCRSNRSFCRDCSRARFFSKQKCCGVGSGKGSGCNFICCRCSKGCRRGNPKITYKSGWWFYKTRVCQRGDVDEKAAQSKEFLQDTWEMFNSFDKDGDYAINSDEFLIALKNMMTDENTDSALPLISEILQSDDEEEMTSYLEDVRSETPYEYIASDLIRLAQKEFRNLDENEDGLIQAAEFDSDLK